MFVALWAASLQDLKSHTPDLLKNLKKKIKNKNVTESYSVKTYYNLF